MTWLCEAYVHLGRHADAKRLASQALDLGRERGQRGVQALCHRLDAERMLDDEPFDPNLPEGQYQKALSLGAGLGMRPLVARCHAGLAKLYRRTGKQQQADEHFATATSMYREMGMTYWLEKLEGEAHHASSQ